ncbi:MAG: hypothetical protein IKK39_05915 [Thermoguttaceae bacterium]|nr:hypothetical protein [Thermoguttaceae bacterium]MBR4103584.1 hypothetical protein [Thermoguttaceae bacterium]
MNRLVKKYRLKMKTLVVCLATLGAVVGTSVWATLNQHAAETPIGPSLLEVVKAEAAQMNVYPIATLAPFRFECANMEHWGVYTDLTFERYLPFYRFKTKACVATRAEIDECVAQFDALSPKERALVLTAIYIAERAPSVEADRRDVVRRYPKKSRVVRPHFPFLALQGIEITGRRELVFYPAKSRSLKLDAKTRNAWGTAVERARSSEEIAFDALPEVAEKNPEDLKAAWEKDVLAQLAEVNNLFNLGISETEWRTRIDAWEFSNGTAEPKIDAFLAAVDAATREKPESPEARRAAALRDFYFTTQPMDGMNSFMKESAAPASAEPVTLAQVADFLFGDNNEALRR